MNYHDIQARLQNGEVGVMPTDTIYGLVTKALNHESVERIYKLKQRDGSKPLIILISDVAQLGELGILLNDTEISVLHEVWPGPTSVILKCTDPELRYLHRGTWTLAVRLPDLESLRNLTAAVGPLVATSANLESLPPATSIAEAKQQFGDKVDFYLDGGECTAQPSELIKIENGEMVVLR